ncbi:hypothetical protein QCA50_003362 [Cerrena zonata]|uniref:WD repeat protein mio zinc-ribbon like domain-containing protein n=1 Tax=Cerrena zonata TaxID=2478898 RepID=A0AAW0GW73_9APHY
MVLADRRLLWHPRLDNKFLVGGGSQLTVYEWLPDLSEIKHVASKHDLQTLKCFTWSPDIVYDDLVAIGYNTGKVDLVRLEATSSSTNQILSGGPSASLPVRNSRACNALAFCPTDPNYLAVGLDKVRGDSSLVIWDIHTILPALSVKSSSKSTYVSAVARPQPLIPRGELGPRTDSRILQQHAPAEIVSSLAWLPKSTTLLMAGVSHRWLKLFDLRSHSPLVTNVASKVHGIATDPFDQHRIGSFADGVASIWDTRRLTQPLVTFTEKDASADGAKIRPNSAFTTMEFSSIRRGVLATLEKESNHVRFWDLSQAELIGRTPDGRISRDSSQSARGTRLSWATMPWASSSNNPVSTPPTPQDQYKTPYQLILSDTRKTKNFNRSLASFALVPTSDSFPLTSNVMVVNKEGDLELYAVHDTPTHTPWSPRGDLTLGIGRSYKILPGFHERGPPPEPWEILMESAAPAVSTPHSTDERHSHGPSRAASPPPMFGRGDEDGFPALPLPPSNPYLKTEANLTATRPNGARTYNPAILRSLHFEHSAPTKLSRTTSAEHHSALRVGNGHIKPKATHRHSREPSPGWGNTTDVAMQHGIEEDISMTMRRRVIRGYGLVNASHNATVAHETTIDDSTLSELWSWINYSQQLLSVPTSIVEGYNFSYHGIWGIWDGFRPVQPQYSANPTPRISSRGLLLDTAPTSIYSQHFDPPRYQSKSRPNGRGRSLPPPDHVHDEFLNATAIVNARRDSGSSSWQPTVFTNKLAQRQLALYLCGWSLAEDDLALAIKRWEKEHKYSQAACWLVFTKQYKAAIDLLLRSRGAHAETHHMMSGMIAALTPSSPSGKNLELIGHCERLAITLHDPYLRVLLTHLTANDRWADVLAADDLPLRENLAIAFQILGDEELTTHLRQIVTQCTHHGHINGLLVTGLTPQGMEILQTYLDSTGDLQTAAVLGNLNPVRAKDPRSARWLDHYRDLLDQWKLFHFRCQLDIDRGQILQVAIEQQEIAPFEWTPKQVVLKCNYCNKSFNPPLPHNAKVTSCVHCNRPLPRCSICLMTLSIVPDASRNAELAYSGPKDTIDEALVFCQTCRHGGHASHILEWFYAEDGSRSHGMCAVANCHCRCADGF